MRYYWIVRYSDGNTFPKNKEKAQKMNQSYDDINREKLEYFEIYDSDGLVLKIHLDDKDKRLIYRRRHQVIPGQGEKVIWLAGWQKVVNGENVQSIQLLFPDGHIESIGKWKDGLFCKPNLKDSEK